jgi:4-hydroxy-tetrahydrodipicolinate reductase
MSLGINLLIELSKKAAKVLGDQFDIEIIEKHHNQKIDAPSGTALMLADAIASVRDGETQYVYDRHAQRKKREKSEIGLHAVRGGTIVGEHEVDFRRQPRGHHALPLRAVEGAFRHRRGQRGRITCAAKAPACTTCPI